MLNTFQHYSKHFVGVNLFNLFNPCRSSVREEHFPQGSTACRGRGGFRSLPSGCRACIFPERSVLDHYAAIPAKPLGLGDSLEKSRFLLWTSSAGTLVNKGHQVGAGAWLLSLQFPGPGGVIWTFEGGMRARGLKEPRNEGNIS